MDALEFLNENDESQTPTPAAAPAISRKSETDFQGKAQAVTPPRPAAPQPTAEDRSRALQAALDREMARRRWARAEQLQIELEGRRQELAWHQMQKWTSRLLSTARGQQALLKGEIERLDAAHKQAMAREAGLAKHLAADPISSVLIEEEAETTARQRADQREAAAMIIADREAQAEAKREQALQRERQAQAARDADKDDAKPRKKSSGPAAPKPR